MNKIDNIFFNAHHSPIGAFASFTLGSIGAKGGFGLELGRPAEHDVYIGLETENGDKFEALPFYEITNQEDESARYDVEHDDDSQPKWQSIAISPFDFGAVRREFDASRDSWRAGDLEFSIYSPVLPVPDPESSSEESLKNAIIPAVLVELTVDNSKGARARRAYFGFQAGEPKLPLRVISDDASGFRGLAQAASVAVVTDDSKCALGQAFSLDSALAGSKDGDSLFGLGEAGAVVVTAKAGEKRTWRFAVCFHRAGIVTTGLEASYYYTRFFPNLTSVASYALAHFDELKNAWRGFDADLRKSALSDNQKFMIAHSTRSYYGSTQMLDYDNKALWVVNEGEYRMINTFDLTVDQLFFEMEMNSWTVRNELDLFSKRYSYVDQVYFPGKPDELYNGGISFTHDMGVANQFTPASRSSYELPRLTGCFSYMTHEELVNWLCCALVYGERDFEWLTAQKELLTQCFESVLARDNPNPDARTGIMKLDSSFCSGGAEITTYDSLDASLGQSRGNVYLAGKCWAVYIGIERAFEKLGLSDLSKQAAAQARLCENSLIGAVKADGELPAIIGEDVDARIIPVIEGLIFPPLMGVADAVKIDGSHGDFVKTLKTHTERILRSGVCLFPDGGWKLSSTSGNSWLSKIYLCQYIARAILNIDGSHVTEDADAAHVAWLLDDENTYWCWSDQMVRGKAKGSRYYPRGVTSFLWLTESR
jgi:hypothetical protein